MSEEYLRLARQFLDLAEKYSKSDDPWQRRMLLVMLRSVIGEADQLSYSDLEKLPPQPHDS